MTIEIICPKASEVETGHARFVSIYRTVFTLPPYLAKRSGVTSIIQTMACLKGFVIE